MEYQCPHDIDTLPWCRVFNSDCIVTCSGCWIQVSKVNNFIEVGVLSKRVIVLRGLEFKTFGTHEILGPTHWTYTKA